jgi:hypothetical protein
LNNKNSYDHFLTPNERVFYVRQSIDETQKIIDECWKVIRNPKEQESKVMEALELALYANVSLAEMLKIVKQLYQDLSPITGHDHDYGR